MNWVCSFRSTLPPAVQIFQKTFKNAISATLYRASSTSALSEIKYRPQKSDLSELKKRPKRNPFVASFFMGKIDEELFEYAELPGETLKRLEAMDSVVDGFYKSTVTKVSDEQITDIILKGAKSLGLFGMAVPKLYGGLELSAFEMNRLAETISQSPALFHMINFHNIYGVNILLEAGTQAQKQLLLPRLATGESTFAACIWEHNGGSDLLCIETRATSLDSDSYLLSGSKIWVNNADNADYFMVLADLSPPGSKTEDKNLTFFIVNKSCPGITMKPVEKTTLESLKTFEVSFDNVILKSGDMVGKQGQGFDLANSAILRQQTVMPSAVLQTVRSLFNTLVKHIIQREQFGRPLFDFNQVKWKIANASVKIYVLESMVYRTAGLCDVYEGQDTLVESTITRVFALETLQFCLNVFSDVFGSRSIEKDSPVAKFFRDAPFYNICEGTKDVMKLHISLTCLRLYGELKYEEVSKLRNPLQFPVEKWRDLLFSARQSKDQPKLTHVIADHVHPSLKAAADNLEYCINRLCWATDLNIVHYGYDLIQHQNVIVGLADMATICYAMASAISRASRSYCIGLKNAHIELSTAHMFTTQHVGTLRQLFEYIDPDNPPVHTQTINEMAEIIGAGKGYFAEHPTQRTFD